MARTPNEKQHYAKREMIIEKARNVFCQKGFLSVTMKDIVEACGISRGGLYLFFSSVEEVFKAVISNRNISRFETVRKQVEQNADFSDLFDIYFNMQKDRILHMEKSLLRATYEYYAVHQNPSDIEFRNSQIACIKKTILDILNLGVTQGAIVNDNIDDIAENYILLIEGMSIFGVYNNISEANIMAQIQLMKNMLNSKTKGEQK
jgi:AcrR family transcriptional regulator